ncbi:MAG: hypothetical protein AAGJ84_02475 [Pseudomonadota bacterium]
MLRVCGAVIAASILGGVSYAQTGSGTLQTCLAIPDDAERLACFDALASAVPDPERAPSETAAIAPNPPQTELVPPVPPPVPKQQVETAVTSPQEPRAQDVAVQARPAPPPRPAREESQRVSYDATVVQTQRDPYGKLLVKLSNGEIWKQTSRGRAFEPKIGSAAAVRQSFSGAWFVDFESTRDTVRMVTTKFAD